MRAAGGADGPGARRRDPPLVARSTGRTISTPICPQGYQISQLYHPIVGEGALEIEPAPGETKTVGIERIHIEQDAGKLIHDQDPRAPMST
jgi:hypothetical protein